jgi:aspartate racemase
MPRDTRARSVRFLNVRNQEEPMRTHHRIFGIVGGTGPESTIDYYRSMVATWRRRRPDGTYPRVIVNSVDGGNVIQLLGAGEYGSVGRIFGSALGELAAAGCGAALIASNLGHLAFEHIDPRSPIRLVHIVDATLAAAAAGGHRRVGIIGTRYVVESSLYPDRFTPAGIGVVPPTAAEENTVHEIYFGELLSGVIRDASRARIVEVIAAMRDRDGIDGLILGGTELALTLTEPTYAGILILNTAQIHVDAAVDWLLDA